MNMEPICSVYDEDDDFLIKNDDDDDPTLWLSPQDSSSPSSFHCLQGGSSSSSSMANLPLLPKAGKVRINSEDISSAAKKIRRLSADQVRYLEKTFDQDNKLEPERKAKLAKELGLQPRQVAIWFQNRRARYKTKLLQKDCDVLKSSYDRLKQDYDALCSQNDKLKIEIDTLVGKLQGKEKGREQLIMMNLEPLGGGEDDVKKQSNKTSSAESDVVDCSDSSPRHGDSSHDVFEAAADAISDYYNYYCEEEEEEDNDESLVGKNSLLLQASSSSCFPKIEVGDDESSCYEENDYYCLQPNSCSDLLGLPVQDHGTWFWQI